MNYFTGSDFLPKLDEHAFGLRHPEEIQVHVEDPSDQDGVDGVSEHLYSELASYAFKPSKQFTNPFGLEDIREVDEDSILWSDGTHDGKKQYHKARRQYHAYIRTEDDSFPRRNGHLQSPTLPMFLSHSTQPRFHDRKSSRIWPLLSSLSPWSLKSFSIWRRFGLGNSQALWLTLYFLFNLLLTLSNKSVLLDFPFPYTLTAFHALVCSIGGYFLRSQGYFVPKPLKFRQEMVLAAFSVLYAINIAVSNVSLNMVTVPVCILEYCLHISTNHTLVPSSRSCCHTGIHHYNFDRSVGCSYRTNEDNVPGASNPRCCVRVSNKIYMSHSVQSTVDRTP